MDSDEKYLGGFYSLQMSVQRRRSPIGCGVYVTNRRLFVLPSGQRPSFDKRLDLMPVNLSSDENARVIRELDGSKEFDVAKDRIARIELKIPPGLFRTGHLHITITNGEVERVHVGRTMPGVQLRDMLRAFYPEALVLV